MKSRKEKKHNTKHKKIIETENYEPKFDYFVNNLPDALLIVNIRGTILLANIICEKLFGYKKKELIGNRFELLLPKRYRVKHRKNMTEYFTNPRQRGMGKNMSIFALHKNGTEIMVDVSLNFYNNFNKMYVMCSVRDVTDHYKKRKQIIEQQEQLHEYTKQLQTLIENERKYIAREIHDDLGQHLTALKMDVRWISKQINSYKKDNNELFSVKLKIMCSTLDSLFDSVRKISAKLRPPILDDLGLEPALEWYLNNFQNRYGIKCTLKSKINNLTLDENIPTVVFRIFQELLTNIARHSGAKNVLIKLNNVKGKLILEVIDDGKGTTIEDISNTKSLGILGMNERAHSANGELDFIETQKGTHVKLTIPL